MTANEALRIIAELHSTEQIEHSPSAIYFLDAYKIACEKYPITMARALKQYLEMSVKFDEPVQDFVAKRR